MKATIAKIISDTIFKCAEHYGFAPMEIMQPDKIRAKRRARAIAIHHLRKCGFPNSTIAKAFKMSDSTASSAGNVVLRHEDRELIKTLPRARVRTSYKRADGDTAYRQTIDSVELCETSNDQGQPTAGDK